MDYKGGGGLRPPPPLGSPFLALLDGIFILAPQPHGVPAQLHGIPAQLHGGDGGPNSSKKGDKVRPKPAHPYFRCENL